MDFYSVQLRKHVDVPDGEIQFITMKNGKRAATATIERDGKMLKLFQIVSSKK